MARSFAVAAFAVLAAAVLLAAPASAAKSSCAAFTEVFETNVKSVCQAIVDKLDATATGGAACVYNGTASSDALLTVIKTAYKDLSATQKASLNTTSTDGYKAALDTLLMKVAVTANSADSVTALCTKVVAFAGVKYATVTITATFNFPYTKGDPKSEAIDQGIGSGIKKACATAAGGNQALAGPVTVTSNAGETGTTTHAVRKLLAAGDVEYVASVPVANANAASGVSGISASTLQTAANTAVSSSCTSGGFSCATLALPTVTAKTAVVSGASALSASVLSVASAMLVLLFGF